MNLGEMCLPVSPNREELNSGSGSGLQEGTVSRDAEDQGLIPALRDLSCHLSPGAPQYLLLEVGIVLHQSPGVCDRPRTMPGTCMSSKSYLRSHL